MEIPSLQSEVNRKAIESLTWLTDSVMKGEITKAQFSTGVDALFLAVSGLVSDKDFIGYITAAQSLCDIEDTVAVPDEPEQLKVW